MQAKTPSDRSRQDRTLCVLSPRVQQCLDCAPFIHRAVAFCHLFQWQGQVEDLARIDFFGLQIKSINSGRR